MSLVTIPELAAGLKNEKTSKIKLLHKFIFKNDGDRQNRNRLRDFSGFELPPDSPELANKIIEAKTFTLSELVTIANILCIKSDGTSDEIATRIVSCLNDINYFKTQILHEDSDAELIAEVSQNTQSGDDSSGTTPYQSQQPPQMQMKHQTSFSDIEGFVTPFSAESFENVNSWFANFDDAACLLGLTEIQKIIFAKKCMSGRAELFMESETKIFSYSQLKNIMLQEFGKVYNSADVHETLSKRKMRHNESFDEYFYAMKRIANMSNVDDISLIKYVINGISDGTSLKSHLYGCKTLIEFKAKLKIYEEMKHDEENARAPRAKFDSKPKYDEKNNRNFGNNFGRKFTKNREQTYQNQRNMSCYNCGDPNHLVRFCTKKTKCFACNGLDHKSFECPKKSNNNKPKVAAIGIRTSSNFTKTCQFNDISVQSLVDTGSEATLLKESVFKKLNVRTLHPLNYTLRGFGRSQVKPLGSFECEIKIDELKCLTDVYVVENDVMSQDAILGLNVLMQGETIINESGVIVKNKHQNTEEVDLVTVLPIDVASNDIEVNVDPSAPKCLKDEVRQLVLDYQPQKTKSTNIELKICVKNNEPISHQPRRLPFSEKKIVEAQVAEWLDAGIVEPSSSEYCSPVVIVKKKDGTPRVCIDYRRLNKVLVKDRFPLPLIEDILDRLQAARVFSTIDLRNGFFHVDVEKESRKYTAFVTHEGVYQYLKVPFGLSNSPAVFQRFINTIFRPLINDGIVLPYMDDIIILSSSVEEGIERFKQVLTLAGEYGLEINFKKSHFLKKKIEFLGHIIEEGKISPSPLKTHAVLNFPEPSNVKQVQSFLGLTGYFRKFINMYSIIARPLSDLLKKNSKFVFGDAEKNSFNKLKSLLAEKPVLAIYNPNYETELHTDASLEGYGAILLQKSPIEKNFRPTYYMSKKTTDAEKKYSSYELEVLAIIEALKRFRVYLLGIPFKIVTDCSAFQKTMDKRDLSTRVARWVLLLQEFHYSIEHRSGTKMSHVDALSRFPISVMCVALENITSKIKLAQENDSEIIAIKKILENSSYDDYCNRNGVLYKFIEGKDLLVVPQSIQMDIIKTVHEKGHTGIKYTEKHLEEYYHIPKLRQKIENVIDNCVHCILVNRKRGKKEGFLHPRHKVDVPLHTYHVDHLGPLESTNKRYKHILVVIDAFTKFVWIYPTKSTTSAEVITKLELQKTVFGSPSQIITDKGTAFTSSEFSDYCTKEEITHHTITTGLPRANGQVERVNQVIISVLAKLSLEHPTEWYRHTNELQRTINSTYQRSIDTTPFELLIGTKMNTRGTDKIKELIENEFQAFFETHREEIRKHAKEQIFRVQQENRKTYNLRRRAPNPYRVGNLVAIKRTQFGPHLKLKSKYFGPYKITKVKGGDTYDVTKEGDHEGPLCTTTCAEFIKNWTSM